MSTSNTPRIKFIRSFIPGKQPLPSQIEVGEIAVNVVDGVIYTKNQFNQIVLLGGSGDNNNVENVYLNNLLDVRVHDPADLENDSVLVWNDSEQQWIASTGILGLIDGNNDQIQQNKDDIQSLNNTVVKSVNGKTPTNNDVSVTTPDVLIGTMDQRDKYGFADAGIGELVSQAEEGHTWIVRGDSDESINGTAFVWAEANTGAGNYEWVELTSPSTQVAVDALTVRVEDLEAQPFDSEMVEGWINDAITGLVDSEYVMSVIADSDSLVGQIRSVQSNLDSEVATLNSKVDHDNAAQDSDLNIRLDERDDTLNTRLDTDSDRLTNEID